MKNYYLDKSDEFGWGPKHQLAQYKINELLVQVTGNNILDIGCGPGNFVHILTTSGFNATGIDITPKFIKFAKKNYQGNFIVGDATKLPFDDQTFDTVFIRNVVEHLPNDLQAIKEGLRVGKKLVLIVPQTTDPKLKSKGLIYSHYQDQSHLRTYTPNLIKKIISQTKGELVEFKFIEAAPVTDILLEMIHGPLFLKKVVIKPILTIFPPKKYYLEIMAIIKPCQKK